MPTAPAIITRYDHDHVASLLASLAACTASTVVSHRWRDTLQRAIVVEDGARLPGCVVAIGSRLELRDLDSGTERDLLLVKSEASDMAHGHLPVLSALGAALLGRAEGDVVICRDGDRQQRLRIAHVQNSPVAIAAAMM